MRALDVFLGDSERLRDAERELEAQEDRVFQLSDGEDHDLGVHVRADIPRFQALNARQRLTQIQQSRKSDRNLMLTFAGFLIVAAKLFGATELIWHWLQVL